MKKITEQSSHYDALEQMTTKELLENINREDQTVPRAIENCIPSIEKVVHQVVSKMKSGGRLFYLGAGTSGRLGIVDASECPPTFGVPHGLVVGLIAGGDQAIRKAVEFAEDDPMQGWKDLVEHQVTTADIVIGIAASGTTPYVVGALEQCNKHQIVTACITCNEGSPLAKAAQFPIECIVGPEFVTGSTRMKAGTAQKLILNMISTSVMIQLGHVIGNKMVDMQLSNHKLVERAIQMVMSATGAAKKEAQELLSKYKSVRDAIDGYHKNN